MMLGLCRPSSCHNVCKGVELNNQCGRAAWSTEANEQDLAELQRLQSHDAASEWHLRSTWDSSQFSSTNTCIEFVTRWTRWMPSQLVTWVVFGSCGNEGSSMIFHVCCKPPMFWAWAAENSTHLGKSRCYEVVMWSVDSWHFIPVMTSAATEDRVKYWQLNSALRSDHQWKALDTRIQWVWLTPKAAMKKAIWEEWQAFKCYFAASRIDFQNFCWNLQSLCLVSLLRLIYFQHQCHSPFSTCHGMSRHCVSMCFASSHRLIFDLTLNMWYMWYICTFSALPMSFRHHWCIWVWCRPSWRGFSYSLSMETDAHRLLEWMTKSPKVKTEEGDGSKRRTFVSNMIKPSFRLSRIAVRIAVCIGLFWTEWLSVEHIFKVWHVECKVNAIYAGSTVCRLRLARGTAKDISTESWDIMIRSGVQALKFPPASCFARQRALNSYPQESLGWKAESPEPKSREDYWSTEPVFDIALRLVQKTKHALVRPPSSWDWLILNVVKFDLFNRRWRVPPATTAKAILAVQGLRWMLKPLCGLNDWVK